MRYKLFGKSGLRVSEICLGTMTFGETWGWGASKEESRKIFELFVEAGGNFIDTANNYTDGTSEEFVGELVAPARERFVVATKYTLTERKDDPNGGGNSRKNMVQTVERSLRRLNTDYVDILYLHMWDFMTPIEEVMRGLDDLVRAGKVLYVGISDTPAWVVSAANTLADLRGWSRFVGLQVPYSIVARDVERDLLPMARAFDMAVATWAPMAGGVATGKYFRDTGESKRYGEGEQVSPERRATVEEVIAISEEIGRSPAEVAINWVRAQRHRANIIPIVGARTAAQMQQNLGCLQFELTEAQVNRLNDTNKIKLGFPHSFLTDDEVTGLIFGNTFGSIDNHRT
jgi:aryl-alcohol dehydrogenase-like predicted oxidoreductase